MAELGLSGITAPLTDDEARELLRSATISTPQLAAPIEPTPLAATPLATPFAPVTPEDMPLRAEATAAAKTTPQATAFDLKLQEVLGLPTGGVTNANRDTLKRTKVQRDIENKSTDAPVLRGFMRLDPDLMKLSSTSIDNLAKGERAIQGLTFQGAFSHGVDLLQGLGWRFVEATGELVGSEDLEAFGQAKAEAEFAQAEAGGVKKKFLDIDSVGDFFTWLKQTGGEQIPLMAPSLVGGIAGGVAGSFVPIIGTVIGAALGAFIPSFILGVGETQNAIKERDKNVEAPGAAFGAGAIIGALDSLLPGKIGTMIRKAFGREAGEKMLEKVAFKIMAKNAAAQGGKGAGMEGITEAIQEAISETTAAAATGQEIDGQQLFEQMVEGFAAGFFLGGGVTTVTSVGAS